MSRSPQDLFDRVAELTDLYLLDQISDDQLADLESLVRSDTHAASAMRTVLKQAGTMRAVFNEQRQFASRIGETNRDEYLALLQTLTPAEEPDTVTLLDELPIAHVKPSAHEFAEAARYLFERATANKRALYTAGSAIAAVLLLALTLVFVFSGGDDEPMIDPLADTPLWDTPTPTTHRPVVATLTDAVGAQWRSDDKPVPMPMGAQLVAFERFTLTHGFAEITTRRGAKALLQAPCTIELTDSDNAVRLHQGKLVGKCETVLSKGFTVHAPGMDVVDLGTEFGVAADAVKGSTVLVMQGSVRAQPAAESPRAFEPVVLKTNQARRIQPEVGSLGMIAVSEAPVFYEQAPHPYVAAVLDAAPVAYWRFEDDANTTIVNEIEPGQHDLVSHGSATLVSEGLLGSAAWLDNEDKQDAYYATRAAIDAIDTQGDVAIELWFWVGKELTQDPGSGSLVGLSDAGDSNVHYLQIELQPRDAVPAWHPTSVRSAYSYQTYQPGDIHGLFSRSPYALNQWQHLVLNRTGDQMVLYLNGQESGSYPIIDAYDIEEAVFSLGKHLKYGRWLIQSKIDEVAIYDRVLSKEEINTRWLIYKTGQSTD